MCACVGWCARGLVSPSLPLSQLSHIASPHVCLCWMVRPPFRRLVFPFCLPLSRHMCAFVGWGLVLSACVGRCACLPEVLSPLVSCLPCLRTRVPVFDGASAFTTSCLPFLSPIVTPHVCACDGMSAWWHFRLPEVLSPLVSPCLPLSPHNIRLCWMVCPPSQGLVSPCIFHCLPPPFLFPFLGWCARLFKVLSPWSPRVPHCSPFSPIVSPHVCLFWMVCPPSPALLSPSLPLSPLSPIVSHCLPTLVPVLDGASAFSTSCLPFCLPTCVPVLGGVLSCLPVLDGVSAFSRSCLPLSPTCVPVLDGASALDGVSAFPRSCLLVSACVGWCVRLPEVLFPLVSHLPSCFPLLDGVSTFSTSCLLSPTVSSHASLCEMVCPLPQGLVSTCLPLPPIVRPIASHCLPSCLPVSRCLRLRFIVSHCLPTCVPVLDGVSVFGGLVSPLSPIVSPHWCAPDLDHIRLQEALSPHVSHCLPTCVPVLDVVPAFPRSCLLSSPIVSHCLPTCVPVLDGVSHIPRSCLPLSPIVSPHVCL